MSAAVQAMLDGVGDLARRLKDDTGTVPPFEQLSEGYARLALHPGSAVLILAPNTAEFLFHWIAALANGYVPCAAAPSSKAAFVAALRRSLNIAAVVGPQLDLARHHAQPTGGIGTFQAVKYHGAPPAYEPYEVLVLTTGTSGLQTACVHTVDSLVCNANMTNKALHITAKDRQLVVLPFYHSYGLVTQSLGAIISGCQLSIDGPPFSPARFAGKIQKDGISVVGLTPTLAREILRKQTPLPPIRSMSIGGDRVTPGEVASLLQKPFVRELYITYGLTEAGPRVSLLPAHDAPVEAFDSVGRAFDGVTTTIEAPDANGVGQLLVQTPSRCRRRVGEGVLRQPFTSDGFLATGDLFKKDEAGYLRYVARQSDIVMRNGEKLNIRSIDSVAAMHPDVEYARTTVGDTEALVTRLWARENRTLNLDDIRAHLASSLRLHEVPDALVQERHGHFHK